MKHIKTLLTCLLVMCMAFCLFACNGDSETSVSSEDKAESKAVTESSEASSEAESKEESKIESTFTVKIVDQNGDAVEGAMVQICKDACIPAKANTEGIATFSVEITDGYKLSVLSCPSGYEYNGEAEVYLENGMTEYTLELTKTGN